MISPLESFLQRAVPVLSPMCPEYGNLSPQISAISLFVHTEGEHYPFVI